MKYAKLLIASILFLFLNLKIISANEISNRHLYYIGDEINFSIETKLPNKSKYVSKSRLIDIKDGEEIWNVENSPTADKRIYDRETGNWIASYKDGNEIEINWTDVNAWIDPEKYKYDRANEYPSIVDQLDYIYHNGVTKWKTDMITPVKEKYPKP